MWGGLQLEQFQSINSQRIFTEQEKEIKISHKIECLCGYKLNVNKRPSSLCGY